MKTTHRIWLLTAVTSLLLNGASCLASSPGIAGQWKTIDDKTGKEKSIVEIYLENGVALGRIIRVLDEPDGGRGLKCDKCQGELKDQPIIGLQIINGMTPGSGEWGGGTILDPDNGKTYRCKITLGADGNHLQVRGFIGISLLGRTQVWRRVVEPPGAVSTPSL
jgi:uncharacterized protein (DUF2147 family)